MPPAPEAPDPLLATARLAADAAAAVHLEWVGHIDVDRASSKAPGDFVSQADLDAQEAAVAVILERHPGHAVLAEEDDAALDPRAQGPTWIVDPLDGTANFLHGHPAHAASVAVAVDGTLQAGAVACAATGERWWAARGGGAWKGGRRIRVSDAHTLSGSLIGTGFPFKVPNRIPEYLAQLGELLRRGAGVRRGGSAALDLCYLAEGRFDGFWELFLNPWDFAAGALVALEAGSVVRRVESPTFTLEAGSVLAGNEAMVRVLAERLGASGDGGAENPVSDRALTNPM